MMNECFVPLARRDGELLDLTATEAKAVVLGWSDGEIVLAEAATHYGVVAAGTAFVCGADGLVVLRAGQYFVLPGGGRVQGSPGGVGLVISRLRYLGLRQFGGPLESEGRLRYIDGCSDTLLVCPPRLGEPCLNHLHVPAGTHQTPHTHPSARIGVVTRGGGECRTAAGSNRLTPGLGWYIPAGCVHSFHTEGVSLDVIAWHPDSDFGPTDEDHPMIRRTVLA